MILHAIVLFVTLMSFGVHEIIEARSTHSAKLRCVIEVEMPFLMRKTVSVCSKPFIAENAWIWSITRVDS